jgi:hypothetical protein
LYLPASSAVRFDRQGIAVNGSNYEVVVKGRLSTTLIAAIDGFEPIRNEDGLTHLVGWIGDQSRMHGVLEVLRDLNIELISINPVV